MIGAALALTLLVTSAPAGSPGEHMVEPANGSIAAVDLRPARHRFDDDRRRPLHGIVETRDAPSQQERLPICEGVAPARICIAP